jgi:hypothetical protein
VNAVAEQPSVTLNEILGRLEWILEALSDGDQAIAVDVLLDLRDDLLGATAADEEKAAA